MRAGFGHRRRRSFLIRRPAEIPGGEFQERLSVLNELLGLILLDVLRYLIVANVPGNFRVNEVTVKVARSTTGSIRALCSSVKPSRLPFSRSAGAGFSRA